MWNKTMQKSIDVCTTYLTGSEQYKYCIKPFLCMILCGSGSAYVGIFPFQFRCIQKDIVHVVSVKQTVGTQSPVTISQFLIRPTYK